ncbi:MAG: nicotinate-nicotinamide nucleotide adenylyltransferase [Streptococcaceae bacterium]|nr:nicotinate-nicotinamide nucleotide adenylyltransferase [Streptococcaceae bacterium]
MSIELLTPFTKVQLEKTAEQTPTSIGLFWGNFNPIHMAHLTIADQVRQQLQLEKVIFLPEYNPDGHVEKMLKLGLEDVQGLELDTCRLSTKESMVESVKRLKETSPDTAFYFIIGSDVINTLSQWKEMDALLELVQLVAVRRPRYRVGTSLPILWVDVPAMDISGNMIREQFHKGMIPHFLLPEKVLEYIMKEGLYV